MKSVLKSALLLAGIAVASPQASAANMSTAELRSIGREAAADARIPFKLLDSIIQAESAWGRDLHSAATGASGVAGILPWNAARLGIDADDPEQSLYAVARWISLYSLGGSWEGALAAYLGCAGDCGGAYDEAFAVARSLDEAAGTTWNPINRVRFFERTESGFSR